MLFSGPPDEDIDVPDVVRRLAGPEPLIGIWQNELGGLTWQIGSGPERRFVKWSPPDGPALSPEIERLLWAASYVPVPRVIDAGSDHGAQWLLTAGLPGQNAVTPRWRSDPLTAVVAIGKGLRELHDRAPVDDCPYDWSTSARVAQVVAGHGQPDPARWHSEHSPLTFEQAKDRLLEIPEPDQVVCHGDACAPNTLLDDDGTFCGLVDLGALGVGDRWADLATATWSTVWNYGPGWENALLDAYGIDPDPERTAYYRLLWDLGP